MIIMRKIVIFTMVLPLLAVGLGLDSVISAHAGQIYRYTDPSGAMCFTDNIAEVPQDKRPGVVSLAVANVSPQTAQPGAQTAAKTLASPEPETDSAATTEAAVAAQRQRLMQLKGELDAQFTQLMTTKKELLSQKELISLEQYNQRVQELNAQVSVYETRRRAFEQEARSYNQTVMETAD